MVKTAMLGAVALVIALGGTCGVADALPLGQTDDPMIVAHRAGTRDFPRTPFWRLPTQSQLVWMACG